MGMRKISEGRGGGERLQVMRVEKSEGEKREKGR